MNVKANVPSKVYTVSWALVRVNTCNVVQNRIESVFSSHQLICDELIYTFVPTGKLHAKGIGRA